MGNVFDIRTGKKIKPKNKKNLQRVTITSYVNDDRYYFNHTFGDDIEAVKFMRDAAKSLLDEY